MEGRNGVVLPVRPSAGKWILPQPKDAYETGEFVPIPRLAPITVPFGYEVDPEDPDVLLPIPEELLALEQAKKYLKRYSSRHVAAWLTKVTGRSISHTGLLKRVKDEQSNQKKTTTFKSWARRLRKALELAERYEKTRGARKAKEGRSDSDPVSGDGTARD